MRNEELAERIGHLQGTADALVRSIDEHRRAVEGQFERGTERMDELQHQVDHLKNRAWKQLLALVIVTVTLGKATPWVAHWLNIPIPK